MLVTSPGIRSWIHDLCNEVAGNCSKAMCVTVQGVAGNCSEYVEKVFKNIGHKLSRSENNEAFDLKTNVLIWELFMSPTMKSAVHLGFEYQQNLIACRNTNFEELKTSCDITLRLIVENSFEIHNLSTMIYDFSPWMICQLKEFQQ